MIILWNGVSKPMDYTPNEARLSTITLGKLREDVYSRIIGSEVSEEMKATKKEDLRFYFKDEELLGEELQLNELRVCDQSTIEVRRTVKGEKIALKVQYKDGDKSKDLDPVHVNLGGLLSDLKKEIDEQLAIPYSIQVLSVDKEKKREELGYDDKKPLKELGVTKDSVIYVELDVF